ncbi:hypothetical protein ANN_03603 [Periplaneta americana]|uniref:Uncharacterized protein n=1 Tax=Periplaneta americana TaxID=6978 RepID=A0ABQ8U339_PERAM|nr:hypothetical protein ANN_03603 [Periplaneta americana]
MAGLCEGGNEPAGSLKAICIPTEKKSPAVKPCSQFLWETPRPGGRKRLVATDAYLEMSSNYSYCFNALHLAMKPLAFSRVLHFIKNDRPRVVIYAQSVARSVTIRSRLAAACLDSAESRSPDVASRSTSRLERLMGIID